MKKSLSPIQQVWQRFKKNKPAMFGLWVMIISSVIALFCFVFIPDHTPDANRMSLTISSQSPGFGIKMLKVKKKIISEEKNFLSEIFNGSADDYDWIPISQYRFERDRIYYTEFSGVNVTGIEQSKLLQEINSNADSVIEVISHDEVWLVKPTDFALAKISALQKEIERKNIVSKTFWLGTDHFGRDLLSRILAGTRISLAVGFIAVLISLLIGITLGALAGFYQRWVDDIIMWLVNIVWSIPTMLLVIAITLALGKGFQQVFIAVGCTMWVDVARIVRGQFMSMKQLEFADAARTLGFRNSRIIFRHILPNIIGPVVVVAASNFATAILLEAGLSFLGIGVQPPTPSWGTMIKENYGSIIIPDEAYLAIIPGVAIMLLVMSVTFVANGLRDAFDSKQKVMLGG